jgi:hypothetical protein
VNETLIIAKLGSTAERPSATNHGVFASLLPFPSHQYKYEKNGKGNGAAVFSPHKPPFYKVKSMT